MGRRMTHDRRAIHACVIVCSALQLVAAYFLSYLLAGTETGIHPHLYSLIDPLGGITAGTPNE